MKGFSSKCIALKVDVKGPENTPIAGAFLRLSDRHCTGRGGKGLIETDLEMCRILAGTQTPRVEERARLHPELHCRHQNNICIQMGSDESHFNVSLIARDKVSRQ